MAQDSATGGARKRASVRRLGNVLQARVSAGKDPSTGERIVLTESVPIEKPGNARSERAAAKVADKVLVRLQGEADSLKVARTKATFGALLDKWLPQHELDATTRMNYESMISLHIRPVLGDVPLVLLVRTASERLETFYGQLRRHLRSRWHGSSAPRGRQTAHGHVCVVVRGHRCPPR